jgi:CheY-like chemotaxis protein
MASQTTRPIIDEALPEGSLRMVEPQDQIDAVGSFVPPVAANAQQPPRADTGLMYAVLEAEGADQTERQDAGVSVPESQPVEQAHPGLSSRPRVLIVEDTVELAELVVVTLRRARIEAEYEVRGERAFVRYVELLPSVVLLDLNLPDMTGWNLLESIKDHASETGTPMPRIVIMTALGDPANRLVGKLQGVHSYLVKPFTPADMQRTVQDALAAHT